LLDEKVYEIFALFATNVIFHHCYNGIREGKEEGEEGSITIAKEHNYGI
jgi:hypothetical protein